MTVPIFLSLVDLKEFTSFWIEQFVVVAVVEVFEGDYSNIDTLPFSLKVLKSEMNT